MKERELRHEDVPEMRGRLGLDSSGEKSVDAVASGALGER
jgi:hypothetical protein